MERYSALIENLSLAGILAGAVVIIMVGSLWYSTFLFGRAWMRHSNIRSTDISVADARRAYLFGTITALFQSFLVAVIASHTQQHWVLSAICIFVLWLFIFIEQLNRSIWERAPLGLIFIHSFRALAALMACAFTYHFVS